MAHHVLSFSGMAGLLNATTLLTALGALVPPSVLLLGVVHERRKRAAEVRNPQSEKLLRPPGHSLSKRLDHLNNSVLENAIYSMFACILAVLAMYVAGLAWGDHFGSSKVRWSATALAFVFSLATILFTSKAAHSAKNASTCRLGLRGEQAVAEALCQAASEAGYRIFHDVQLEDGWNIDHIAVGTRGVFAIETKARCKPLQSSTPGSNQRSHEVHVENNLLRFPTGAHDRDSLPQAERNARDLSKYLTRKTGEPTQVTGLLVLPGWYIVYKDGAAPVFNPKLLMKHLRDRPPGTIQPPQLTRIITAIEEKCRDVDF